MQLTQKGSGMKIEAQVYESSNMEPQGYMAIVSVVDDDDQEVFTGDTAFFRSTAKLKLAVEEIFCRNDRTVEWSRVLIDYKGKIKGNVRWF